MASEKASSMHAGIAGGIRRILAAAGLAAQSVPSPPDRIPISKEIRSIRLQRVYPGKTLEEIEALLRETWTRRYAYKPFVQFVERPCRGRYVNVDPHGFRHSARQDEWPPDKSRFNVFVFGGSTAFGYGLADYETVASCLREQIEERTGRPTAIYNFAGGHYYSTQERILFANLVLNGHAPNLAIFIDGLNEFFYFEDEPLFTKRLHDFFDNDFYKDAVRGVRLAIGRLPPVRWLNRPIARYGRAAGSNGVVQDKEKIAGGKEPAAVIADVLRRYRVNMSLTQAVAARFGVATAFVWEPIPTYRYDRANHLFAPSDPDGYGRHSLAEAGYKIFAEQRAKDPVHDLIWCADIQDGWNEPLYVDAVHYTAELTNAFARCIAAAMQRRGLLPRRQPS